MNQDREFTSEQVIAIRLGKISESLERIAAALEGLNARDHKRGPR